MTSLDRGESYVLTPLGQIPRRVIGLVAEFGAQANRNEFPAIDVGGFIVLGREAAIHEPPSSENDDDVKLERAAQGRTARQQAGPEPRSRQRCAGAAPGATAQAIERKLALVGVNLAELRTHYPETAVVSSSDRFAYVVSRAGLFHGLPFGAEFLLEIPTGPRVELIGRAMPSGVPDIRAWATWSGGALHGRAVRSHHMYPDGAICACMLHEFIRGVHPIRDYAAFCAMWSAKVVHELIFGTYPGRQHYPAHARRRRDRESEFCGCGSEKSYAHCCRAADRELTALELWADAAVPRRAYFSELEAQRRPFEVTAAVVSAVRDARAA
jgi:hypothetical protein